MQVHCQFHHFLPAEQACIQSKITECVSKWRFIFYLRLNKTNYQNSNKQIPDTYHHHHCCGLVLIKFYRVNTSYFRMTLYQDLKWLQKQNFLQARHPSWHQINNVTMSNAMKLKHQTCEDLTFAQLDGIHCAQHGALNWTDHQTADTTTNKTVVITTIHIIDNV